MRYSAEWQDDAPNAAPEERATVADLRLFVDGQNVTQHLDDNIAVDHLTIPLYSLAYGLLENWWRLFGGRDHYISLTRFRMGFAVPDIRLAYDGSIFEISAVQRSYVNPALRFWSGPTEIMARKDAEEQLAGFISKVLERLDRRDVRESGASLRWARIEDSRRDPEEALFCEAAGALGLDPYAIDDATAQFIESAGAAFEGEPLTELLAGLQGSDPRALLAWVGDVDRRSEARRLPGLGKLAGEVAVSTPTRKLEPGWSIGYRRAKACRRILSLSPAARFSTPRALAEKLGGSKAFAPVGRVNGIRALRSDYGEDVYIHMRMHGQSAEAQAAHLFSFTRAVGDVFCFPEPTRAPVNDLHAAVRQAAGRSFAAEFLAPIDEIHNMRDDGRDNVSIADEFSVSVVTIERQIENADRIAAACA